ncbi:NAD(P)-dependent oxidoreductase [Bordetella bronchiseptica]|uniref:Probable 6-phosphogluconate dehydrogenase n=2 Tax=Bordetella bronchiseptica TaxID=518 RepID=A0A0C6P3I6_BORBO|nr:6-phosphogluconate dehydrogenase [Bordetella bronchiseptica]CCJ54386.1 probable 6-phosphogluconate dehydrogenase [Bordetella bronchiseptica 253]SHR11390.1 3-hydroxyisobutyrate dehydrogenase [Mycobacteroides abscessus subsp. abscessus]AZW20630.1 NAD(P)-dependent oxidoreductase [Bordetella bronchiseptica]KFJ68686.1 NAD binding domain of 6-phosphogluconate dehydrogenase family protein [Bordetella bronchiseptica]
MPENPFRPNSRARDLAITQHLSREGRKVDKIGFIGLGNMGAHMARRLCEAGYAPAVFDVDASRRAAFEAIGASWADSPQAMADQVSTVVVSLPTPAVVEEVLTGAQGLIHGKAVKFIVDTSTTGPEVSKRAAERLAGRAIQLVDAPVSGGTSGAADGSLSIMVSGAPQAYETVSGILRVIGRNLFYLGEEPGQGQLMKVINNTICAAATLASFEGLVLGSRAGIDARVMLDIINVSSGRNFSTEVKIPQCVVDRNFPLRFTTALLHKDVKLCLDEAARQGVPMWVSDAARQMLQFAISQGDGPVDYGNVIKRYEAWAGTQFGSEPQPQH